MLELRRLRLLRELRDRGTIAAVADALQFTPSAVSQQLAILERETGVRLLERAGRGVRLTDPALVLAAHADALLERAAVAEADLAAAAGTVTGRARIAGFRSVILELALPAMAALAEQAPRLRCEVVEAEPEQALPALAGEPWATGHAGMGWEDIVQRTCRELGGFEPDLRHRANDATVSLALV